MNEHPECVSLLCLSSSEPLMRKCVNTHPGCESLSSFWADWDQKNLQEWVISIQLVSSSLVFEQIRTTDENGWTPIQVWVPLQVFKQIKTTYENGWTPMSPIQLVSHSSAFEQIRTTDKWMNTNPDCESLFTSANSGKCCRGHSYHRGL